MLYIHKALSHVALFSPNGQLPIARPSAYSYARIHEVFQP